MRVYCKFILNSTLQVPNYLLKFKSKAPYRTHKKRHTVHGPELLGLLQLTCSVRWTIWTGLGVTILVACAYFFKFFSGNPKLQHKKKVVPTISRLEIKLLLLFFFPQ